MESLRNVNQLNWTQFCFCTVSVSFSAWVQAPNPECPIVKKLLNGLIIYLTFDGKPLDQD